MVLKSQTNVQLYIPVILFCRLLTSLFNYAAEFYEEQLSPK